MANPFATDPEAKAPGGRQRPTESGEPRSAERHFVGATDRGSLARFARSVSFARDLPSSLPGITSREGAGEDPANASQGLEGTRRVRPVGMFHRRLLYRCKKGGRCVGKTKRGKGTKVMALADRHGLPLAVHLESASPN